MNIQHVFWFCFVASFSSASKAAKSLPHEKNETTFNLQSERKLSSNSTASQPLLLSSDIRSEAQDVVSYLPIQNIKRGVDFKVEKSKERDDVSLHSLTRNSDILGEVSLSLNDNNEHGAKGNSSDNVKSTDNYETPLEDNSFGSSTKEHVSSGHSEDNDVSNYYYEDEGVTENEFQKEITKTKANGDILRNLKSEVVRLTLSEPSAREGNLVTYTTDSSAQSMLLDDETRDHDNITESNTDTTVNNDVKGPNDTGKAMQSGPDRAAQNNASEYTYNIFGDAIKNSYTGRSTAGIVPDRIKELNSLEIREGIYRTATSEESAKRYRTLKHTLGGDKEPSHSPNQVENDYADDYYEVWRQNKDRPTTVSATEGVESKATNDKNLREYVPYFPKLIFGTEKITNSTSNEVTNANLDYDSTLSEEGVRATTGNRKQPVSTKNVPYFPTGQDAEQTFTTENVKNVYIYDEVKTAAYDRGSTIREEGVRATIITRKPPKSVQDSANSKDVPKNAKTELSRDLENVNVANNNATPRQLEKKYSSIETTNNGSSSVSQPTVSPYGTSRKTSYAKTNKFNCSANESVCSTTPQELTTLKSVHNFGNGSEIDLRAQRGSWRKDFQVSDDFAASEDCHAGVKVKEDDREDTRGHELPTKQKLASDNSDIPENYDTCAENDTDTTAQKITPETQKPDGEVWNKQGTKNKPRKGDDTVDEKIMTMAGSMWNILPKGNNRAGVRETSLSEYPWFVIIETSSKDMRCAGAMVAPRWLMTASSCVREDDTRTDAYSAPVQVRVNVTGRWYQAVRAVFAPGGGVALVRLAQPPESALFSAGRLDLADVDPPTLWTCCVALGLGSCEEECRAPEHWEQVLAVGTWAVAVEDSPQQRQYSGSQSQWQRAAPGLVRAPCGGDPGAPLACHRRYMGRAGLPTSAPPPLPPPENEPEGLFLVAVAAGHSKPGLGCRGSYADYWNVATLQGWLEDAIVSTNVELDKTGRSRSRNSAMLLPDPYSQRLHRMRKEGSLPEPRFSRAATRSGSYLLPLLTAAAASYTILLGS